MIGTKLAHYEITSHLGTGGMGEVYQATDSKLGRSVAIKLLPEAFTNDADRAARFEREARVLASINHPNIAAIHGLEESGGRKFLVMELVPGETLAEKIKRGAISLDESLGIAAQITEALEAAHEKGVMHRDLKPANIKVTPEGKVKVLDFGLAKAFAGESVNASLSNSPTISHMATRQGLILGTAAYMSPEQAKGKELDRRTDIFAFGAVLYEMLTGKIAFHGDTTPDTLAAVIRGEPNWSLLPAETPPALRALLRRCLQKEARQRLRDIGDARIALEDLAAGKSVDVVGAGPASASHIGYPVTLAIGLALLTIAVVATWKLKPSPEPARPVVRFTIDLPLGQRLVTERTALALSADGSLLAYAATGEKQQIYLRAMASGEVRPVAGTEGGTNPFFSPDGQWLGFFAAGKLQKVLVSGGVAQPLEEVVSTTGASWGSRGTIVFSPEAGGKLYEVPEQGGARRPLNEAAAVEAGPFSPAYLPNNNAVLFARFSPTPGILVEPIGKAAPTVLVKAPAVAAPHYVSSGHLIYAQAGKLMAAPFDAERLKVTGSAVLVVSSVLQAPQVVPAVQYSVSETGTLVYVSGAARSHGAKLVWVDRSGVETPLPEVRNYDQPRISPDGKRIAVNLSDNASIQLWLYDVGSGALSPFPSPDGSINGGPVWTPDGKRIAYSSNRDGPLRTFWQLADGGGAPEPLMSGEIDLPFSFSPDGKILATVDASKDFAIWLLHIAEGRRERFPPNASVFKDAPQFSPDGNWVSYVSTKEGRPDVYVAPYPGPGGQHPISSDGGTEPVWRGREIFYRVGDKLMAVHVETAPSFSVGKAQKLFEGHYLPNADGFARPNYDVSPNGQHFLMVKPAGEPGRATQIEVVLNWTEELKRLVPTK
jgi:serine/threonine-protein kinase